MGVPDPFRDSSLLREHAYYDTGNVEYVIPESKNKKLGFMSVLERGLGDFDYKYSKSLLANEPQDSSSILYILLPVTILLVASVIAFYILKFSNKDKITIKETLKNIAKNRKKSTRKLKSILPISHIPDASPPSLSSTPELSDVESFEPITRNFKFDTIVDDLLHTFKSWTVNEFDLDNLRVN